MYDWYERLNLHRDLLRTERLSRRHGWLTHARRPLWKTRGGNARLARHHALLLESCPPLFFQFLLDFVDFLCQEMVVLRLEEKQLEYGRRFSF